MTDVVGTTILGRRIGPTCRIDVRRVYNEAVRRNWSAGVVRSFPARDTAGDLVGAPARFLQIIRNLYMLDAIALVTGAGHAQWRSASPAACLDVDWIVSRRAVGGNAIEFTLPRRVIYRSAVSQECSHLAELDRTFILAFENRNGRCICGGDRFRLIDPTAARISGGAGFPFCRFCPFVRVTSTR